MIPGRSRSSPTSSSAASAGSTPLPPDRARGAAQRVRCFSSNSLWRDSDLPSSRRRSTGRRTYRSTGRSCSPMQTRPHHARLFSFIGHWNNFPPLITSAPTPSSPSLSSSTFRTAYYVQWGLLTWRRWPSCRWSFLPSGAALLVEGTLSGLRADGFVETFPPRSARVTRR